MDETINKAIVHIHTLCSITEVTHHIDEHKRDSRLIPPAALHQFTSIKVQKQEKMLLVETNLEGISILS